MKDKIVTISNICHKVVVTISEYPLYVLLCSQGSATAEMEVTKTTKSVTIDVDGATTTTVESSTTSGDGAATGGGKAGMISNTEVTTIKILEPF